MAGPSSSSPDGRVALDAEGVARECDALEMDIAELRARYGQYFIGIERVPPIKQHAAIKRRAVILKDSFVRQTALKFRIQSIAARLLTYETMWTRTLRSIEEGTHRRDPSRRSSNTGEASALRKAEDLDLSTWDETPGPSASRPQSPKSDEAAMRRLFDLYLTAKERCGEDTSRLTYEALASSIRKKIPALMKQHGVKSVEFKVAIRDGRAVLRGVPGRTPSDEG